MRIMFIIFTVFVSAFSTQWLLPSLIPPGNLLIGSPSFTSDNSIIYSDKWHDSYWQADTSYYIWNGSAWEWGDWVQGDVNTTEYEQEPFLTYDGQHLYFQRWDAGYNPQLYVADWNGSAFVNSRLLNSSINQGNSRFPSITQDIQFLYFTKQLFIYVSQWNDLDWDVPTMLPPAVNGGGGLSRDDVTITPDGNELFFTGAGSYPSRLAFSQKIGGVWQQWQYCDSNLNIPGCSISSPALTYAPYAAQELYFARTNSPGTLTWHALRSPVSVEPASIGQIKATYR